MTASIAYKVLLAGEMATLEQDGRFEGSAADHADGYIHLSTADQLTETVDKHYAGSDDLHVVAVDLDAHGDAVRWEPSRGGASFPHLYAPMLLETAVAYGPLCRDADGRVTLPVAG